MEGKKIKGRKRQIIVDTEGNLHQVLVHGANVHDTKGGAVLAERVLSYAKGAKHIVVDLGYRGELERMLNGMGQVKVCFTRKVAGKFVLQAKRWVVERTFAWLNWSRRLCKDFELKCIYAENMLRLAAIALTIKQFH